MENKENHSLSFIESEIDIEDEKPYQSIIKPSSEISDGSDIEIIAVSENIANGKRNKFLRPIYNRKRTKVSVHKVNSLKEQSYIKEEIIISDESDGSDIEECKLKSAHSNGIQTIPKKKAENPDKSLSAIILNCPRCNKTEKVFSITIMSSCKDCNVNMSYICNKCNCRYDTMSALYRHKKIQCHLVTSSKKKKVKKSSLKSMFLMRCKKCSDVKNVKHGDRACLSCGKPMNYECSVCGKHYGSYSGIYLHVRRFCQLKIRTYYCNDCTYTTTNAEVLLRHLVRNHPILYRENVNCEKCDKHFDHYSHLKQHERYCGAPLFICKFCSYRPKSVESLTKHLHLRHANEVKIQGLDNILKQIDPVEKKSNEKAIVQTNSEKNDSITIDLNKLRSMCCRNCKKSFEFQTKNTKPCETCGANLYYECTGCFKTFPMAISLSGHLRRCHKKVNYSCQHCNRGFATFDAAKEHRKNCGQEPRYQCKLCPFKTRYRSSLSAHTRKLHNSERHSYKCSICGIIYKTSRAMNKHNRICKVQSQVPD